MKERLIKFIIYLAGFTHVLEIQHQEIHQYQYFFLENILLNIGLHFA